MIALASDHIGTELKLPVIEYLKSRNLEFIDFGTFDSGVSVHYPEYAIKAAKAVAAGECERGILFCGTGIGVSIVANKVKGVRCAACSEPFSALLSRQHNDSNMLALGSRVVGKELAIMIVQHWLDGEFQGGRHAVRVGQINQVDETGDIS